MSEIFALGFLTGAVFIASLVAFWRMRPWYVEVDEPDEPLGPADPLWRLEDGE
jgi:hypothetical protein